MPAPGNVGRNNGIIGLVDLPGLNAKFAAKIYRWKPRLTGQTRQRRGRGGGVFRTIRWLFSAGTIALEGSITPADTTDTNAAPTPDQYKGQTGTITCTLTAGKTVTYPIIVTEQGFDFDAAKNTLPRDLFAAEITGAPTYTGFGTQQAATDPTRSDQQQWEGSSKTLDPSDLQSASTSLIDWWDAAVADTDAGESAKLATVIAAASAPFPGMKIRTATIARDAYDGGTITITRGRTTTAEDVVNAATHKKIDPNKIETGGTIAAINSTPSAPTVAGQTIVVRTTDAKVLNDGNTLNTVEYGQRTTAEDITMPGTTADIDKAGIASTGQTTVVFDTTAGAPADAAPPDGSLQVTSTAITQINRDESQKKTGFKVNRDDEQWIFDHTNARIDPSSLTNQTILGDTYIRGSEPSPPGVSGLVLNHKEYFDLTSPNTTNLEGVLWYYGETTSADDLIFAQTNTDTDPNDIRSTKITGALFTTGSPPDNPSPPTGLKLVKKIDTTKTNASASNESLRLYFWGKLDSKDEILLEKYSITTDPSATLPLTSKAIRSYIDGDVVDSTLADSNGNTLYPTDTDVAPLTLGLSPSHTKTVREFGLATPQQAKEAEQLKIAIDGTYSTPLYIKDKIVITKLWVASGSPPSDPTTTLNAKIIGITDAGVPENPLLLLRVWMFGPQNSADELSLGSPWLRHRYGNETDVSRLTSTAIRASITVAAANADPGTITNSNPSTVTDSNGDVLVRVKNYVQPESLGLPLHDTFLVITEYALATPAQMLAFERSENSADPFDIFHRADTTLVTVGSGTSTDAFADAALLANMLTDPSTEIRAKRRTPMLVEQTIITVGDDQKEEVLSVDSREWPWWGKPQAGFGSTSGVNPAAFGNPGAYSYVIIPGNSNLSGTIQHALWWRARTTFKIRRRLTRPASGDPFLPQVGTVNSASFRGRAANTVKYLGGKLVFNNRQGGTRPMLIDLYFQTDDAMFMSTSLLPAPNKTVSTGNPLSPFVVSGFYDPSTFAGAGGTYVIVWPPVSSFTSFGVLNS